MCARYSLKIFDLGLSNEKLFVKEYLYKYIINKYANTKSIYIYEIFFLLKEYL